MDPGSGAPYASLVGVADDGHGTPLLVLSGLADHSLHLRSSPRAALLISASIAGSGGELDRARVTLSGRALFLEGDEAAAARARYLVVHPDAEEWLSLPDFTPVRFEVIQVRYVGGFGRALTLRLEEYRG